MAAERKIVERVPSQVKFYSLLVLGLIVCLVAAYFFGIRGSGGPINVSATIEEGQRLDPTREPINDTRATKPNGGLVPTGLSPEQVREQQQRANPSATPPAEEAATTTDESATSTDAAVEEGEEGSGEDSEGTSLEELSASLAGEAEENTTE